MASTTVQQSCRPFSFIDIAIFVGGSRRFIAGILLTLTHSTVITLRRNTSAGAIRFAARCDIFCLSVKHLGIFRFSASENERFNIACIVFRRSRFFVFDNFVDFSLFNRL
uniref:Uncharacterized protein n=1 Tax=Romanomermis culicivorax TaxID=13658 RepID=A0A915HIJ9_ROMCU